MSIPEYAAVNDALARNKSTMDAAESHGLLCGMLCACGKLEADEWQRQVLGEQDVSNVLVKEALRLMQQLYVAAVSQLSGDDFGFQLFLPEDDVPMRERAEALAHWCQSFSYGLGVAIPVCCSGDLPIDSQELMKDLIEISKAALDDDESDEVEEEAYTQISEYVRMGVMLINDELRPLRGDMPELLH